MTRAFCLFFCLLAVAGLPTGGHAEWQAIEKVETYAVAGRSGPDLYASIGARGPKVGGLRRAIAYTDFKLTWTRKYENRDGACVLASALPKLIITYRLPRAGQPLPQPTQSNWDVFVAGVARHERVHGDLIKQLVAKIEAATVGLIVAADPECRKIRLEMTKRLAALSQAQRQQSRDFDRLELSEGGNIHQLVLQLVNGQ